MTKPDEAQRHVEETLARSGRIDVLVNNAGRAMAKPAERIDVDEHRQLLDLNVIAPLRLMQLVIPARREASQSKSSS